MRSPDGAGTSATLLQKVTPFFVSASAHSAKTAPGGESAPAPRNHGSTTALSVADGVSPSSICFAWYQPIPRLGTPAPTTTTSQVLAEAITAALRGAKGAAGAPMSSDELAYWMRWSMAGAG